ncbi:hypothetical protein ACFVQ9_35490 [Streptomyces goshikiensis]|uniref:hypothetical protein n=1 Tax=Streptomyces goshikiensis TaxID=1942 RepID=UPI0036C91B70
MTNRTPLAGEDVLPVVDEVLAGALEAQGEQGARALGLIRDAHRILSGAGVLERSGEIVELCVRSAADALLRLPGAPKNAAGLQSAAKGLLKEVDALPDPAARSAEEAEGERAQWQRLRGAAAVLRDEIAVPGGHQRRKARGIAERVMGVSLGASQETALGVWSELYSTASGTLHGASAVEDRPARLYAGLLGAARELLVPLPERAARVLQLAALTGPGKKETAEFASWADPRATAYFFGSGPAPGWLEILAEHAPHLLLPDESAGGWWPAAPFLEHVAGVAPDAVRAWLAAPAGTDPAVSRAQQVAAAGRPALDALLGLALRHSDVVGPAALRTVLAGTDLCAGPGPEVGATLRLAARWARGVPRAGRTREWVLVVEELLAGAVEAEHAGHLSLRAVVERVAAAEQAAKERETAGDRAGAEAAMAAALAQEEELTEQIAEEAAARLPGSEVAVLLRELAATAYPAGRGSPAHRDARMIRAVLAALLARDVALLPAAARPLVFAGDLALVHAGDPAAYGGPGLARTVLDLADADADAGAGLDVRTRAWHRVADTDARLNDRLLAAHLAARPHTPPGAGQDDDAGEGKAWWERAIALTPRLVAAGPAPEPARLVHLLFSTCPPEHAGELEQQVRTALGAPPPAEALEEVLPADADQVDGTAEPLTSWLRVWDWSPVLDPGVLAGWEPVLERLRRLTPAGPRDPRTAAAPLSATATTTALTAEDLAELAEARGPVAAAATLAAAPDAGADGYAMLLHGLVAADPSAWTADVPAVLAALELPELGAFYLAAAARYAGRPGAFPGRALADTVTAALGLRRALDHPAPEDRPASAGRGDGLLLADQALFDLLTTAWRTGAVPDAGQEQEVLAHLHALAAALARPAPDSADLGPAGDAADPDPDESRGEPVLLGSDPRVRALGCLLEYASGRARAGGGMPAEVLQAVAGALPAAAGQDAVATAIGVRLPDLHRYAPEFTARHRAALYGLAPDRPSPAASWLRWGPPSAPLLAALDRADLIDTLRAATASARDAAGHTAAALLTDPALLGDPAAWWAQLAGSANEAGTGAAAISRLLQAIALRTPSTGDARPFRQAEQAQVRAALALWRAALNAGLPAGALAGAGAFADAAFDEEEWLQLMRSSADHSPALEHPDLVAERAAGGPGNQDALLLAAVLVTHPSGTWTHQVVLGQARALLDTVAALPAAERPSAWEELRTVLVNAGDIAAAGRL